MLNPISDGTDSQAASKRSTNRFFSSSILGSSIFRASLNIHIRDITGSSITANGASHGIQTSNQKVGILGMGAS
jgi:hypothetical protein